MMIMSHTVIDDAWGHRRGMTARSETGDGPSGLDPPVPRARREAEPMPSPRIATNVVPERSGTSLWECTR